MFIQSGMILRSVVTLHTESPDYLLCLCHYEMNWEGYLGVGDWSVVLPVFMHIQQYVHHDLFPLFQRKEFAQLPVGNVSTEISCSRITAARKCLYK